MSRKNIVIGVSVLFFFPLLVMIISGDNGFLDLKRLKKEKAEIVEQARDIELENLKLYRKVERLNNDPVYIENVARQELGMIGKDEIILRFKDKR